jgi:hypothetical protein
MQEQIDKIVKVSGIEAACLVESDKTLLVSTAHDSKIDPSKWRQIFDGLSKVLDIASDPLKETDSRTIIGDYSLTLIREGDRIIGTASKLGHPVAKSLRRMMKRAARRRTPTARATPATLQPSY